jgi:hypothetical protein
VNVTNERATLTPLTPSGDDNAHCDSKIEKYGSDPSDTGRATGLDAPVLKVVPFIQKKLVRYIS